MRVEFTPLLINPFVHFPLNQYILNSITADIYGGQSNDGGGIALITSYVDFNLGTDIDLHTKCINALQNLWHSPPPPPIVQRFLEYCEVHNQYHPHLHLDNRSERDFDHYEIWKYKYETGEQRIESYCIDTGYTDHSECVYPTGMDNFWWNRYYFAKTVDYANKISIPSKYLYYLTVNVSLCVMDAAQVIIQMVNLDLIRIAINKLKNFPSQIILIHLTQVRFLKYKFQIYQLAGWLFMTY